MNRIRDYFFGSLFRKGATLLTTLTLASYMLGLIRDILFAHVFGASRLLDIYNAAFIVPDILLNIFVAGALTAAFVPIFVHLRTGEETREAEKVATTVLAAAPLTILILALPIFIAMPYVASIIAPGFIGAEKDLLVSLSRLMLLSPIIFAISNTLGNILISYERFLGYGLSPILYNLGIVAGVPLALAFGPFGLIAGTLGGALLHVIPRIVALSKSSFTLNLPVDFKNKNFRHILKLMIPRMAGQPIEQVTFSIFTNLASTLFAGSIAMLSFARNFQSVPISIFGISFSTAIFASLSRKAAAKDTKGFMMHFNETAKALALTTGASMLFFIFFGRFFIQFFLGGGRFNPSAVASTGMLLSFFALSIPSESFNHLLVRSFYALKDTWTPIMISIPGLVLIILLAHSLVPIFSLNALPISYAIASNLEALTLYLILRRRLRTLYQ